MSKQEDTPRLSYEGSGTRQIRATALGRGTHGVPDVRRMVESQFHVAFPHRVWVAGQVGAPADGPDGTLRFPLRASTGSETFSLPCVVPGEGHATLRGLLHRTHDADLEDVVREGRLARIGGLLRYDAERNSVVFVVSELDPTPTALELAGAREQAVGAVREAGLDARQRALALGRAPLEVAVVGGEGDAALDRVERQLADSPYDVRLTVLPVLLTRTDAGSRLAQALRSAAQRSDVVLLVRDEGRPLGLAAYDDLDAAQAVADAPVPVLAGLGGAGTRTACDEVAYASFSTASAAVREVLHRLGDAERLLGDLAEDVDREVDAAAARCRRSLEEAEAQVEHAGDDAVERSRSARRQAQVRLLVGCVVAAVLVVAAALLTSRPLLLLLLLVPVAVWAGVQLWWRSPTRGRGRMGQRDDDFTQVLVRLHAVRDELTATRSPERVGVLRQVAGELVAQGRELLGRSLDRPDGQSGSQPPPAAEASPGPTGAAQPSPGPAGAPQAPSAPGGAAQGSPEPPPVLPTARQPQAAAPSGDDAAQRRADAPDGGQAPAAERPPSGA